MTFDEVLAQVQELLEREGRVSYRALKRRFSLDDDYLENLKEELIKAKQWARDEEGAVLVWTGGVAPPTAAGGAEPTPLSSPSESLTGPAAAPQPSAPHPPTLSATHLAAERRQLTVMFCDVVGSTALAERLDLEELREVILAYQQTCADQIRRFDGYLARHMGDGLLVYFGYPQAHEDDAQRAIRAGLSIVAALPALNTQLHHTVRALQEVPLQVRIGIHTGLVVVGDMGGGGYRDPRAIVGETPNIAARVQGIAEPNTVVISAATYRLVQGLFECHDRGPQALKGVSTLVPMYRVLRESEAQNRFEVAVSTGLTPLVGRDLEVGLLRERWAQAKGGEGQVVLLSGEAGIGKSRLVQTLKEQVTAEGATCIEFRCSPYHQNSALYPIIMHLQRLLQFQREESPQAKLEKLQQVLARYRFPQADTVSLLVALLSLPPPAGTSPLTLSPQKQKQKTQEALVAWMVEEAERQAVYCGWKDLHWADPSTLELLTLFLDQVPTTRLLAVLTFRSDFTPSWRPRSHITQLTLHRLGRQPIEAMIEQITGGKPLPLEVVQQIVAKTDGVPLFVEELTKMVLESGLLTAADDHFELTGPLPPLAIPSTLHDSLMARLDRLAPVKEVVQLGATLGREFSYEVLQAVAPVDETSLQQALAKLVEAEVLYQRGQPLQARYLFKHALIQDAAYQSLLKSTRQQYHKQIAQVLERQFPETRETEPELLAHHYTQAGLSTQAIPYWQKAGQRATGRSAHVEAIRHLTKGLEVLKALPDTPERAQQELALQITLGVPLTATKGYAAPEVARTYTRAQELCQQVGETRQLIRVLFGQWRLYLQRAELQTARELGEQLLSLARRIQNPALLMEAHFALEVTLSMLGEFAPAWRHFEQGIALYDPQKRHSRAVQDPGVGGLSYAALVLWPLGYPDQALKRSHEAIALAQELSHPFSLAVALDFAAWLHQFRRERQAAQERTEAAIAVSTEHGFPFWLAMGTTVQGWVLAERGQGEEGITQIRQGLSDYRATGAELAGPYFLALLAEAYGKGGQAEAGLSVLAEALAMVDKNGERMWEAELYRLKGELTLQKEARGLGLETSPPSSPASSLKPQVSREVAQEVEGYFLQAIKSARGQSAKSLELRAVMSLSRLRQQQDKKKDARKMLAEIYGWFTEGFDTTDLQEAKALLQELV